MSRALGHSVLSRCGVSTEPEFSTADLSALCDANDAVWIVAASDGVWDMMDNDEVTKTVAGCLSAGEAALKLTAAADAEWVERHGSRAGDNITAVVVRVHQTVADMC